MTQAYLIVIEDDSAFACEVTWATAANAMPVGAGEMVKLAELPNDDLTEAATIALDRAIRKAVGAPA